MLWCIRSSCTSWYINSHKHNMSMGGGGNRTQLNCTGSVPSPLCCSLPCAVFIRLTLSLAHDLPLYTHMTLCVNTNHINIMTQLYTLGYSNTRHCLRDICFKAHSHWSAQHTRPTVLNKTCRNMCDCSHCTCPFNIREPTNMLGE